MRFLPPRPRLGARAPQRTSRDAPATPPPPAVAPLRPRVEIPAVEPGDDARAIETLMQRGQFLARQEDWEKLAAEILAADTARAKTPGLRPVAEVLAKGARSDITQAIEQAIEDGATDVVSDVLADLDSTQADAPDCPAVAVVLALAHIDAARAWRDAGALDCEETQRTAGFRHHMGLAAALNDRFDPFELDSPLWASVRCALLEADASPRQRMADDYEDLIDLDPDCLHHLCAFGRDLRPTRFGSWEQLDQQARRTAARTADVWGAGGYTWIYLGALGHESSAFRRLDAELFVEGLHDIMERRPTQDMANRLAAFVGYTLGGPSNPGTSQRRIADCLSWLAQDYLRELHPTVWAEVPPPGLDAPSAGENLDPVRRGRQRALSSLAEFYAPALDAGRRLVFGPDGMRMIKDC